jgi:hypothetical protein
MKFEKSLLATMPNPYVAKVLEFPSGPAVLVASEGTGPVIRIDPVRWNHSLVAEGPGGCLDVVALPGADAVLMIGKCYAGYDFHRAGVYAAQLSGLSTPVRLFDLPFLHRLHSYSTSEGIRLVAATIAQTKRNRDDWDRPGAVYVADIDAAAVFRDPPVDDVPLPLRPVLPELRRNHGLLVQEDRLYISGAEGTFRAALPQDTRELWHFEPVFDGEISELVFIDLDGDGAEEMVTIEPFHGDRLGVYRSDGGIPGELLTTHSIAFGHGLWAGRILGVPSVIVGNRSGRGHLEMLQWSPRGTLEAITIAENTGTAQVAVVHGDDTDHIVATNQNSGEVVRYSVTAS